MSKFDSIMQTIVGGGKIAVDKSKDLADKAIVLADITNMKGQIYSLENSILKEYQAIGKLFYEQSKDSNFPDVYDVYFKNVAEIKEKISDLEVALSKKKSTSKCETCESEVKTEDKYCAKCGSELKDNYYDEDDSYFQDETISFIKSELDIDENSMEL
ncbi:MAG: hypothetical protein ACRC7V_02240 [Lachnospiraceae bacterium]